MVSRPPDFLKDTPKTSQSKYRDTRKGVLMASLEGADASGMAERSIAETMCLSNTGSKSLITLNGVAGWLITRCVHTEQTAFKAPLTVGVGRRRDRNSHPGIVIATPSHTGHLDGGSHPGKRGKVT